MSPNPQKFNSMTSYLYDVAFEPREDDHQEVCLDCLNQENPWQALRLSQQKMDKLLNQATDKNQKADRKIDTIKMQLFVLSTAGQRMAIYGDLHGVAQQLKPVRQRLRALEKTLKRLKRINRNQSTLLKQLKAGLLGARGEAMQLEMKQRIEEIEWELMSLWQRAIGAELDKLQLLEQSFDNKQMAISLLDKHLDQFCHSTKLENAS